MLGHGGSCGLLGFRFSAGKNARSGESRVHVFGEFYQPKPRARISNFSDAAAKQDVAAMRVAASNATKALDKIAALEAPDALKDVKSEYEAGANDLGQALSDYVEIYAQIKNAGENLDAAAEAAKGIDDVKARYDSGIEHLSKADSMVADMADSSTSDDASK